MKQKILLDTDIGNDIDDAICLAYLLSHTQCELMGITTVSGEPVKRAMLASAVCRAAGRTDIPIFPGNDLPLLTPQRQPLARQAEHLPKWDHQKTFPLHEHLAFMRQTIRENPGEVTLLAVGPMTNVALLFAADPEIPSLLKELVLMCGVFHYKMHWGSCLTEWNAACDPYATAIMYAAPVRNSKSIGLDVTAQVQMTRRACAEKFTAPVLRPVVDFADSFTNMDGIITFHDPLAAAAIFDDTICGFARGTIDVELTSERSRGLLYFNQNEDGNSEIAETVDSARFFENYFNTVNGV